MALKKFIINQIQRKFKFISTPLKNKKKSAYTSKVMTYAKYYDRLKVKNNLILYQVRDGKSITDSPYAIFKSLLNNKKYRKYTHKWVVDNEATLNFYKQKFSKFKNIEFIIKESDDYLKALAECKYLFNNSTFPAYYTKKVDQIYVNTWHGTPLKCMGLDIEDSLRGSQNIIKNFLQSDYLISPNQHTTEIFKRAFALETIYGGQILEIGYPRIDLTLNTSKPSILSKISTHINLDGREIALYCPTWRGSDVNNPTESLNNILDEIKQLEKHINYQVLVKVHPYAYQEALENKALLPYLIPDYFDTNELLSAIDLIITDYSSIFFDFLVTDKPIIFYTPDYEEYETSRGMYIGIDDLPGPVCHHIEEVIDAIQQQSYFSDKYLKNYQHFKQTYVNLDNGSVTQTLIDYVFKGKKVIDPVTNVVNKKKILIYPGGMKNNGITSSAINLLENLDYSRFDVTIFLNRTNNAEVLNNLNNVNENVRIILRRGPLFASLKEMYIVNFIRQRGLNKTFEKWLYPKKVYERDFRKVFGNSKFDYAIDFSGYSMFWANLILASHAKRKFIFLHSDMKADMKRTINGKRPHYLNVKGAISTYQYFDKLISASDATKQLNKEKINQKNLNKKFATARNTINITKINQLKNDDSDKYEKHGESVLVNVRDNKVHSVRFSDEDFKIVTVGRLSPEKGFDLLIEAVSELVGHYPKVKLYIIGEGALRNQLQKQIKQLKLEDNVFLLGQRSNPFYIMKHSDLLALTSYYEGQSMVLLEALTLGMNILASDIEANRYVLNDGKFGKLVSHDIKDIAKAIEHFIKKENDVYETFDYLSYNKQAINEFYKLLK